MQEPHSEGVAIHADLESCAGNGDIAGEALKEALAGWVLSREITSSRAPTLCSGAEGNIDGGANASPRRALRGRRPQARQETSCTRTGRPRKVFVGGRPVGEAASRTSSMHDREESDRADARAKGSHKGGRPPAEDREARLHARAGDLSSLGGCASAKRQWTVRWRPTGKPIRDRGGPRTG
jgi:hypothetical protein